MKWKGLFRGILLKEIIYLDTDIMNSLLAQLDQGVISSISHEQSSQLNEGEEVKSSKTKKSRLGGGLKVNSGALPGGELHLKADLGNGGDEEESYSRGILEGQRDILNKAFHDYSLNILLKKLEENDLLYNKNNDDLTEGNLLLGKSTFRFYDFDLINRAVDSNAFEQIMLLDINGVDLDYKNAKRIISKKNLNARERELKKLALRVVETHDSTRPIVKVMEALNAIGTFGSNLLKDLTLIKTDDKIGLLKKSYLRESVEALSFRTKRDREVKYLARIIGKKDVIFDGSTIPNFNTNDLDAIPNMMLDIILGSFDIIEKGDLLVTPIAIYYE